MKLTITISAGVVAMILGYLLWPVGQKTSALDHVASAEAAPLVRVSLPDNLSQNAQIGKVLKLLGRGMLLGFCLIPSIHLG